MPREVVEAVVADHVVARPLQAVKLLYEHAQGAQRLVLGVEAVPARHKSLSCARHQAQQKE